MKYLKTRDFENKFNKLNVEKSLLFFFSVPQNKRFQENSNRLNAKTGKWPREMELHHLDMNGIQPKLHNPRWSDWKVERNELCPTAGFWQLKLQRKNNFGQSIAKKKQFREIHCKRNTKTNETKEWSRAGAFEKRFH